MNAPTDPMLSAADVAREDVAYPHLTEDEMAVARACGTTENYPAGWSLYEPGQRPVDCFIVVRGNLEIIDTSSRPERRIVAHDAGSIIGSIGILRGARRWLRPARRSRPR